MKENCDEFGVTEIETPSRHSTARADNALNQFATKIQPYPIGVPVP